MSKMFSDNAFVFNPNMLSCRTISTCGDYYYTYYTKFTAGKNKM